MKLERVTGHEDFPLPAEHDRVRAGWEMWLDPGEELSSHEHRESEEIFFILAGSGVMTVGTQDSVVEAGSLVFVPQGAAHSLANNGEDCLHAYSVELQGETMPEVDAEKSSVQDIDTIITDLPASLDEAQSIQCIVKLFDVGGKLSEQIESAFGLDNRDGMNALEQIERKIMRAVLEITRRYNTGSDSSKIFGHKRI